MKVESAVLRRLYPDRPDSRVILNEEETPQVVASREEFRRWLSAWELDERDDLDFGAIEELEEALERATWLPSKKVTFFNPLVVGQNETDIAYRRLLLYRTRDLSSSATMLISLQRDLVCVVTAANSHEGIGLTIDDVILKLAKSLAERTLRPRRFREILEELQEWLFPKCAEDCKPGVFAPNSFTEVVAIDNIGQLPIESWFRHPDTKHYGVLVDTNGAPWLALDKEASAASILETQSFDSKEIDKIRGLVAVSTMPDCTDYKELQFDLKGHYRGNIAYANGICMSSLAWRECETGS